MRIGQGFDVHTFEEGRELWLGGVRIDHPSGLKGHSDADVLAHALCDALLGAAALGDLGVHFPDTDPEWAGVPGRVLLLGVVKKLRAAHWTISNVDLTLLGEEPKIGPYREQIRATLAEVLGIDGDRVSLKATTMEKLGPIGRGEGLAAMAVALIQREEGRAGD